MLLLLQLPSLRCRDDASQPDISPLLFCTAERRVPQLHLKHMACSVCSKRRQALKTTLLFQTTDGFFTQPQSRVKTLHSTARPLSHGTSTAGSPAGQAPQLVQHGFPFCMLTVSLSHKFKTFAISRDVCTCTMRLLEWEEFENSGMLSSAGFWRLQK